MAICRLVPLDVAAVVIMADGGRESLLHIRIGVHVRLIPLHHVATVTRDVRLPIDVLLGAGVLLTGRVRLSGLGLVSGIILGWILILIRVSLLPIPVLAVIGLGWL